MTTKEKRHNDLNKRLLAYSAAAALALAAGTAQAAAPQMEVDPDRMSGGDSFALRPAITKGSLLAPNSQGTMTGPTVSVTSGTFPIDFDGDGNPEFVMSHFGNSVLLNPVSSGSDRGLSAYGTGTIYGVPAPNPITGTGTTLNTTSAGFRSGFHLMTVGPNSGGWNALGGVPAYLGLRFNLAEDPGNNPHVGWVRLAFTPSGPAGASNFIISPDPFQPPVTNVYGAYDECQIMTGFSPSSTCPPTGPTAVTLQDAMASAASPTGVMALAAAALAGLSGLAAWLRGRRRSD
ncbi:MAG: hypothetical protein GY796_00230 [Chloroflexi bacterium]|nr:hypothetical protein [Chloroflexota bacterium]